MRDDGLTLVEMLAVLAILGIASGAAALSLAVRRGASVEGEAHGLARSIQASADATLTGAPPSLLTVDPRGYVVGDARHDLPPGMRLDGAGGAVGEDALALRIARGDEAWAVDFDGLRATASPR